jgi:cell division protein FtsQ
MMRGEDRHGRSRSYAGRAPRQNVSRRAAAARRRAWLGRLAFAAWTVTGAAVVVFVSLFFVFVHDAFTQSEHFEARRIRIEGAQRLDAKTVAAVAGVRKGVNVLSVNLSAARKRLLALPWVAEAEVRREIPATLSIRIREHVPAAVVEVGKKFLLNTQGEIFKEWEPADPGGLPVVSGLKVSDLRLADRSGAAASRGLPGLKASSPPASAPSRPMDAVMQVLARTAEHGSVLPTREIRMIRVDRELGITVLAYDEAKSIRLGYDDYAAKLRLLADLLAFFNTQPGVMDFERIDLTDASRVIVNPVKTELAGKTGPKGG